MVTPTFLASGGTTFDAAKLVKSSRNAQQDKNDLILKHSSDDCYLKLKKKELNGISTSKWRLYLSVAS